MDFEQVETIVGLVILELFELQECEEIKLRQKDWKYLLQSKEGIAQVIFSRIAGGRNARRIL